MKKTLAILLTVISILTCVSGEMFSLAAQELEALIPVYSEIPDNLENVDGAEVETAESDSEYTELVSSLINDNWEDNYFGEIVVDKENGVAVDGSKTTQSVSQVVENGLDESCVTDRKEAGDMDMSCAQLKENGCEVTYEADTIRITRPFQTKRLILFSKNKQIVDTYGAVSVISDGNGKYILQYDEEEKARRAFSYLESLKSTVSVEADKVVTVSKVTAQANPLTENKRNRWGAERIESDRFKSYLEKNGKNNKIVVAVVDTGIETNHPFLKSRVINKGYDFIHNDSIPDDEFMHGTHCSGIIADNTPDCVKILPIKVFNASGGSTNELVAMGIDYAIKNKVNVISMSFGGECGTQGGCVLEDAVQRAIQAGITCVAAACNESADAQNYCPAKIKECITVASVDSNDNLSYFSNYGDVVDISAPGENIWSSTIKENGYYEMASGTSMACPFVAAAAAMYLVDNPVLTPAQVMSTVKKTAVDLGVKGEDKTFGAGVLDFGVFFKDKKAADSISESAKTLNIYCKSNNVSFSPGMVDVTVLPYDATDKSYTVKIKDPSVATFDGYGFNANKPGETTATFTLASGKSVSIKLKATMRRFWVDYAAKSFSGGSGTQNDPYIVKTAEQLARISYMGKKYLLRNDMYFKQAADIDLKGKTWYPILGRDQEGFICRINYDGNGYKIKNMQISDISNDIFIYYAGLFANTMGEVKNINMIDVDINTPDSNDAAAIVADFFGVMKNCYSSGKILGKCAGGLVGYVWGSPTTLIVNCRSDANVTGIPYAGGITATFGGGEIENCIFTGKTFSETGETGGIAARIIPLGAIANDYDYLDNICRIINCISIENIAYSAESYTWYGTKAKPYIANCYYSGEYKKAIQYYHGYDTSVKKVSKVDGRLFKKAEFYSEEGRWNTYRPWNVGKTWKVRNDYPVLLDQTDKIIPSQFNYTELRYSILLNGYTGRNPYVTVPSKINGKPVRIIREYFTSKNVDILYMKLPDSVRRISHHAFWYNYGRCKSLQYIDLGKGVEYIDAAAFASTRLNAISFPKSLKQLDTSNFIYTPLTYAFFEGDANRINPHAFGWKYPAKNGIKIYYKKGTKGWDDAKLKNFSAKAYNPDVPIHVASYKDSYVKYGSTAKLSFLVYPVSAKTDKLTYKSNNSEIKVSKNGYLTTTSKIREDATITVSYNGKKIGSVMANTMVSAGNYTVKFDGSGATSGSMKSQSLNYYNPTPLSENKFKKKGYKFAGWSLKKGGKSIDCTDKEKVVKLAKQGKTVVLYAVWYK